MKINMLIIMASSVLLSSCANQQPPLQEQMGGINKAEVGADSIEVLFLSNEVIPGDKIAVRVKAAPFTFLTVETDGAILDRPGALLGKRADKDGLAEFDWSLDSRYKADKVPIVVTADYSTDRKVVRSIDVFGANLEEPDALTAEIAALDKVAQPGQQVMISVKTEPGAKVDFQAHGIGSTIPDHTAEDDGFASWNFKIGENYPADRVPLIVTVKKDDRERKLISEISLNRSM